MRAQWNGRVAWTIAGTLVMCGVGATELVGQAQKACTVCANDRAKPATRSAPVATTPAVAPVVRAPAPATSNTATLPTADLQAQRAALQQQLATLQSQMNGATDAALQAQMESLLKLLTAISTSDDGSGEPEPVAVAEAAPAAKPAADPGYDVAFRAGETRPINTMERLDLESGLHFQPAAVVVPEGGSGTSTLVNGAGEPLFRVTVNWIGSNNVGAGTLRKTDGSTVALPPARVGNFLVRAENLSNCVATPFGELAATGSVGDTTWIGGVDAVTYGAWFGSLLMTGVERGHTMTYPGTARLDAAVADVLVFHPRLPVTSLSQCRTAREAESSI